MIQYPRYRQHRFSSFQVIIAGFAAVDLVGALLLMLPIAALRGAAAPGWEKNFHRLHRGRGCTGRDHGAEVGVRLPHLQ